MVDDGLGITPEARQQAVGRNPDASPRHGLSVLNAQLVSLYGTKARLRLFGQADRGTLVAFTVPVGEHGG